VNYSACRCQSNFSVIEKSNEDILAMHIDNRKVFVLAISSFLVLVSACATLYTEAEKSFDITRISAEEKANGLVVTISATKEIGKVEAWIGDDNWLYITIPDTNIDYTQMAQLAKDSTFSKMQYFRYNRAIQVSLQLKEKVDHLDVVRYPDNDDVYIALYKFKT
jgi:hypothetical protein